MPFCIKCKKKANIGDQRCVNCGAKFSKELTDIFSVEYVYKEADREVLLLELLSSSLFCFLDGDYQFKNKISAMLNIKNIPGDIKASATGLIGEVSFLEKDYEQAVFNIEKSLTLGRTSGWVLPNEAGIHADTLGKAYFMLIQSTLSHIKLYEARAINNKYDNLIKSYGTNERFITALHQGLFFYNKGCILSNSKFLVEANYYFNKALSEQFKPAIEKTDFAFVVNESRKFI